MINKFLVLTFVICFSGYLNSQSSKELIPIVKLEEGHYKFLFAEDKIMRVFEKVSDLPANTFKMVGVGINPIDNLPFLYFMESDDIRWSYRLDNVGDMLGVPPFIDATCIGIRCNGCCLTGPTPVCTPCADNGSVNIGICERRSVYGIELNVGTLLSQ